MIILLSLLTLTQGINITNDCINNQCLSQLNECHSNNCLQDINFISNIQIGYGVKSYLIIFTFTNSHIRYIIFYLGERNLVIGKCT